MRLCTTAILVLTAMSSICNAQSAVMIEPYTFSNTPSVSLNFRNQTVTSPEFTTFWDYYDQNDVVNNAPVVFTNANVSCGPADGLVLKMTRRPQDTVRFNAAGIKSKLKYKYGKFEIAARVPNDPNPHASVWLLGGNTDGKGYREIDIFEHFATSGQEAVKLGVFYNSAGPPAKPREISRFASITPSSDYHIFRLEWTPQKIRLYVDGVKAIPDIDAGVIVDGKTPLREEMRLRMDITDTLKAGVVSSESRIAYVRIYPMIPRIQ